MSMEMIQVLAAVLVPAGGGLFIFLLKRTFSDFENKIAKLFAHMEGVLVAQQDQDTRIQLLGQRMAFIERHCERCDSRYAHRPSEEA